MTLYDMIQQSNYIKINKEIYHFKYDLVIAKTCYMCLINKKKIERTCKHYKEGIKLKKNGQTKTLKRDSVCDLIECIEEKITDKKELLIAKIEGVLEIEFQN